MAEFKFSCPQCGQHIQCDTSYSGSQIDCPSCHQLIFVPQAAHSAAAPQAPLGLATRQSTMVPATGCRFAGEPGAQPAAKPKSKARRNVLIVTTAVVVLTALAMTMIFGRHPDESAPSNSIRIKAGVSQQMTDSQGNIWLSDQGFVGGQTYEVADAKITHTKFPELYRTERYSMTAFSWPLRNGKYKVKLLFAEVYSGITNSGGRVFSFNVQGHEFDNFDIWVKAGGPNKAYVESVDVEITNRKLDITFTPQVEKPKINAIEILPLP